MPEPIKIIDLFAGPGGLGEGFSACPGIGSKSPFSIALSIENDPLAHATLTLRAFYRQFAPDSLPAAYSDFISGRLGGHPEDGLLRLTDHYREAAAARTEARLLTLGKDTRKINSAIAKALGKKPHPWVLIGGPPCQAYSLVGRARNKGIANYTPEADHRNFLYRDYLRVLSLFTPDIFVMENVKGMLSANVAGKNMFNAILRDLACPARALRTSDRRVEYACFAVGLGEQNRNIFEPMAPSDYVIRAERFGVPQTRHRVIIVGVRADRLNGQRPDSLASSSPPTVDEAIRDLPPVRSGLSRQDDSLAKWIKSITSGAERTAKAVAAKGDPAVAREIRKSAQRISDSKFHRGSNWAVRRSRPLSGNLSLDLRNWYSNQGRTKFVTNHDTRGHRADDLQRYLFCACFSAAGNGPGTATPRHNDFPELLYPNHRSWGTGIFADRFRVQARNRPGTTVTSHIAKDGHYFIHYDPTQCRSLTVREAARLQTFPDDYFFVGPRTEQYRQVGNAVPPFLARQLAEIVRKLILP